MKCKGELMSIISHPKEENINEILELWNICFPDSPEFTKWYFKNIYSEKNTLIYTENGIICSMLQMPRFKLNEAGEATYIYGACTHPLCRKKGYMAYLLEESFKDDLRNGINQSILIPENESLFKFYEKFGYTPTSPQAKEIFTKKDFIEKKENKKYILKTADNSDINNINSLYEKFSKPSDFILRSKEYWETQIKMFKELEGEVLCLYNKKDLSLTAYAFIWKEKTIHVQEICFISDEAKNSLCEHILNSESDSRKLEISYHKSGAKNTACIKFHVKPKNEFDCAINLLFN